MKHIDEQKLCKKCGAEFVPAHNATKYCSNECRTISHNELVKVYREAHKEECKAYREANHEKILAYGKQWREAHPEKIAAWKKRWYETHKEEMKVYWKEYREAHKEEMKVYHRAYYKAKYHKQHPNARYYPLDKVSPDELIKCYLEHPGTFHTITPPTALNRTPSQPPYYEKKASRNAASQKQWCEAHKEELKAYRKAYYESHREMK